MRAVAIGISTGGPTTISTFLPGLPADLPAAIFLVQHMPVAFIPTYVSRLQKECAIEVVEAETGASVHAGCCYVAGNNLHLCPYRKLSGDVVLRRPSMPKTLFVPGVNVMMESVLAVFGRRTIGVLMTGIGDDGADQMVRIREAGGVTIAESEESCVVFGMPYQAITRGGAEIVLPSWEIANRLVRILGAKTAGDPFDPEQCYLRWEVYVETNQPEDKVRAVFQFVEDDCDVSIEHEELSASARTASKAARFRGAAQQCFTALGFGLQQFQSGDEQPGLATAHRAAQTLISACKAQGHAEATTAARKVLDAVLAQQGGTLNGGWLPKVKLLIEAARLAVDSPAAAQAATSLQPAPLAAVEPSTPPEAATGAAAPSIRVDAVKLDALMRLAGELLVARGALPAFAERVESITGEESPKSMAKEMRDAGAKVSRLADDLQATVMSIRMMPVRQVFQRFPRLVRDIARNLDKNIELHVSGEETELDKTVIDSIGDPLTHIIRNAADHGIESKADRAQKGKSTVGRIDLTAYTRGSNVVIEVKDDGKGLDAEKLKRRAVEKGLLTESAIAAMDEEAAFKIILVAGFSTIDKVTDLSGRGVGMDVVRNGVEALHGAVHIQSEIGKGTSFRIELPASLLVSKAIRVAVSGHEVVLPIDTIRNMVKIPKSVVRTVHGQQIAPVRGTVFPMLWLAHALSFERMEERRAELAVAIIETASGPYGLVVDHFLGEAEIVVKPLNGVLAQVPEYVGAAIMGNGKTVLVVNTERLFSLQGPAAIAQNDLQVALPL